ncbi:MAG TPA: FAD-linked oxidase C-terminal domain-containing protein [Gammaproteobacteria bacterium]|nr:FAD-linked oxidase C-terminal domain-containing protein [Gammaproteobacteria bacterium]
MVDTPGLPPGAAHELALQFPPAQRHTDPDTLAIYATDDTPRSVPPAAVVFPADAAEAAAAVATAYRHGLPVVARGAGSGNVGGALPVPGALVVSFECMDRILEVDPANRLMRVQPGVTNQQVQDAAAEHGLFWPPDPGSAPYCQVGGNIAMNSAGPGAVKRGVTRDWVLGLEAVTGTGERFRAGTRTTKGVVGYDLTRLLIGSEGTLGLVTEATLRLWPRPAVKRTARAAFASVADAGAAVRRIMAGNAVPSALEFMDSLAIEALRRGGFDHDLPEGTGAVLMVEADGAEAAADAEFAALTERLEGDGLLEVRTGAAPEEITALWKARKSLSRAVKRIAPLKINEDVVVPVDALATFIGRLEGYAEEYGLPIVNFGHAGNGNIHVNLMVHPDDTDEMARARACLDRVFDTVLELGGTLSGEHGVGSEKAPFVARELDPVSRELHRQIKQVFDPKGILNPGKAF